MLGEVQVSVDEALGIHIKPQKAPFPTERVNKVAHSLVDTTVPIETIKRRANGPVANVAKSMHDDYMQKNAAFRSDAGLQCYINRYTDGKCCEWCDRIAGRHDYATAPQEVFRRHDNCGCKAIYECGNTRQDIWSKQSWAAVDAETSEKAVNYTPPKLSTEQANAIEQEKLSQFRSLTGDNDSGIIKISMQHFAKRKNSDYPTIRVSKQEYAHVMHEVATNITEEQMSQTTFSKAIGDNVYTFSNEGGFGEWKIIRKRKI